MVTDATVTDASSPEVMASVNPSPCGDELVIADISCDDAWLSLRADDAPVLPDWR
ncbi:DUF7556 family protein [Halegenticoccus tardaugens]|uniref:DUF7556 family protein n=1 Tax=Halegenticoccus tardaugens TaxID=2071624 RepID=UPI0013E98EB3|nr:hypothetical protein [Halegenticoccus tardaugens]